MAATTPPTAAATTLATNVRRECLGQPCGVAERGVRALAARRMTELSSHVTPEQLAIVATYLARSTEALHHRTEQLAHLATDRVPSSGG